MRLRERLRRRGCRIGRPPGFEDMEAAKKKKAERMTIEKQGLGPLALVSRICACGNWTFVVCLELKPRVCYARLWGGIWVS